MVMAGYGCWIRLNMVVLFLMLRGYGWLAFIIKVPNLEIERLLCCFAHFACGLAAFLASERN